MKDRIIASAYFAGWALVRALPETLAYRLFSSIADFGYAKNGKSIQRLRSNLARVKPNLSASELD